MNVIIVSKTAYVDGWLTPTTIVFSNEEEAIKCFDELVSGVKDEIKENNREIVEETDMPEFDCYPDEHYYECETDSGDRYMCFLDCRYVNSVWD